MWGLNDLPRAVAPYSPHWLVFGRDPIEVGNLPPVVDKAGCKDATRFFKQLSEERGIVREKLEKMHHKQLEKFHREHSHSVFTVGD